MRDLRRYWMDRRAIEASLPEFVWVTCGDSAPVHVPATLAAGLLLAKTHRIATEEETQAEQARSRAVHLERKRARLEREGIAVVGVAETRSESDTIRA